jgi:hypothetical protein
LNTYYSGNIAGKPLEQLIYLGGLDQYGRIIHRVLADGDDQWAGFDVVKSIPDVKKSVDPAKSQGAVHIESTITVKEK